MQQENRWRILWPGLSIKDRESIYLCRAIKSRMFHGVFLSLGQQLKRCKHHSNDLRCGSSPHDGAFLICYFENDFQFDRDAKWKACDAIDQAARVLPFSENVLQ